MNDLQIILAHLEDERSKLKTQLDGCLSDFDYEGAHLFQKALMSKSAKIRSIQERREGNRQEIHLNQFKVRSTNRMIDNLNKRLESIKDSNKYNGRVEDYLKEQLKYYKEELNGLSNLIIDLHKTSILKHVDNDILVSEVERLLNKELSSLCLEVEVDKLYYISLFHLGDMIEIQYVKSDVNERMRKVGRQAIRALSSLGFQPTYGHGWSITLNPEKASINNLMHIISRLCFEVIQTNNATTCRLLSLEP